MYITSVLQNKLKELHEASYKKKGKEIWEEFW
jgi:hypothetical protein